MSRATYDSVCEVCGTPIAAIEGNFQLCRAHYLVTIAARREHDNCRCALCMFWKTNSVENVRVPLISRFPLTV